MSETKIISVKKEIRNPEKYSGIMNENELKISYYSVTLSCENGQRYFGNLPEELIPERGKTIELKKCQPILLIPNRLSDEEDNEYLFRVKR